MMSEKEFSDIKDYQKRSEKEFSEVKEHQNMPEEVFLEHLTVAKSPLYDL